MRQVRRPNGPTAGPTPGGIELGFTAIEFRISGNGISPSALNRVNLGVGAATVVIGLIQKRKWINGLVD